MKANLLFFIFIFLTTTLFSCSQNSIDHYRNESPEFNPKNFFDGQLVAKGIVTDRKGEVIKRFHCEIVGSWKGNEGVLDESFTYADGKKEKRIWELSFTPETNQLVGRAHDIIGVAQGNMAGNALHFEYTLKVNVEGTDYHLAIDDWMYLLDENTLMAKSDMSKWGIHLGEINLVMTKVQ